MYTLCISFNFWNVLVKSVQVSLTDDLWEGKRATCRGVSFYCLNLKTSVTGWKSIIHFADGFNRESLTGIYFETNVINCLYKWCTPPYKSNNQIQNADNMIIMFQIVCYLDTSMQLINAFDFNKRYETLILV